MTAQTGTTQTAATGEALEVKEDQVRQFLAEVTIRDLDDSEVLPVADLYGMYIIWCEQAGTDPLSVQIFSHVIREEGLESGLLRSEHVLKGVMATGTIPVQYILETDKPLGPNSALGSLPA